MKKREKFFEKLGVLLLILIFASFFVLAQSNDSNDTDDPPPPTNNVDAAYQCLENLIDDKSQSDLSLQEAIFGTLALGSESKLRGAIEDNGDDECWPSSSCAIKETAQVLLAYDRINKNTDDIEEWLLDHSDTATELTWYLQTDITNHVESTCTLTYQENNYDITINEDLTIQESSAGPCLSRSSSGFWLKVNNNCLEETFRTSCDQDFITSLLYQRAGSGTIFVSPETHSSAALGTTEEEINSKCLKTSSACNYEGTLWAALALDHTGNEASSFLPYLLALASENKKFFPNTFLYVLTQGNDQYSEIVQAQQQTQYWQAPNTPYNRFYDTSLGMLALQGTSAAELTNSQNYLLDIQTPEGCWNNNNIRDTAFVLYSGWPRSVGSDGPDGGGGSESCEAVGNFCVSGTIACVEDAGGFVLGDLDCDFGICCTVPLIPPTCQQQNGIICSAAQTCSGTVVDSLDGSCCLESCQQIPQENECQMAGGGCFSSCTENEDQLSGSCDDAGLVCCIAKEDVEGGGVSVWVWIIILVILIALVVLGIIYRRKLQLMFFNFKNRKRKGPAPGGPPGRRPPHPPYGPGAMRRPMPPGMMRRPMPPQRGPPRKSAGSKSDKELDETLKKLKEMSK